MLTLLRSSMSLASKESFGSREIRTIPHVPLAGSGRSILLAFWTHNDSDDQLLNDMCRIASSRSNGHHSFSLFCFSSNALQHDF